MTSHETYCPASVSPMLCSIQQVRCPPASAGLLVDSSLLLSAPVCVVAPCSTHHKRVVLQTTFLPVAYTCMPKAQHLSHSGAACQSLHKRNSSQASRPEHKGSATTPCGPTGSPLAPLLSPTAHQQQPAQHLCHRPMTCTTGCLAAHAHTTTSSHKHGACASPVHNASSMLLCSHSCCKPVARTAKHAAGRSTEG